MIVVTSPDSTPESGASRPTSASAKQVRLRKIFEHIAAKTPATGEDFDYILDLLGQCVAGEPGSRSALAAENLALRQQVAVYKHSVKRPKLRPRDRVFWVLLPRLWSNWRSALAIVQPETVIKWHRMGFKLYW